MGKNICCCCFHLGKLNDRLFGRELFLWFTMRVFRERFTKLCVCPSFPSDFKGGMWGLIVLIPYHCLSINFALQLHTLGD